MIPARKKRIENLDLARASAIFLVLVHHAVQLLPDKNPALFKFTLCGKHGVDLFFVLSGYLIGGLFWTELQRRGRVNVPMFVLRRALRTMPPYLVMLPIAYGMVRSFRPEQFRWEYLVFFQNYLERIPFFLISWSLCVEEHFYFLLPALLCVAIMFTKGGPSWAMPALLIAASLFSASMRIYEYDPSTGASFGYMRTATHLRVDGLLLGVAAAHFAKHSHEIVRLLLPWRRFVLAATAGLLAAAPYLPDRLHHGWGLFLLNLLFAVSLLLYAHAPSNRISRLRTVSFLAAASYGIYLVHTLTIHAILALIGRIDLAAPSWALWMLFIGASLGVGSLFYLSVDKATLRLRKKLIGWIEHRRR